MQLVKKISKKFVSKIKKLRQEKITFSLDSVDNFIITVYRTLLNRDPEDEALKFYSNFIRGSEEDGLNNFMLRIRDSDEFNQKINDFIVTIYRNLLNRHPDDDGLNYYSSYIKNSFGNGLEEFILEIINSDEFNANLINLWSKDDANKKKEFINKTYWEWIKANDDDYLETFRLALSEINSKYKRTDVINRILSSREENTHYLEIGVRNLDDNFSLINANVKYSVDPGDEVLINKADFKLRSDEFFELLSKGSILSPSIRFDVIFIDGLHLADQVDRDINNALKFLKDDGFIVMHDCNPPTEWHARETYYYFKSPADGAWNGTVWKAFLKKRFDNSLNTCCIDTDWGVGIISKNVDIGTSIKNDNPFFEYKKFAEKRKEYLNLISFNDFENFL